MVDHIANRNVIVRALFEELVGPAPQGEELGTSEIEFNTKEEAYGPFVEKGTGEEILQRDVPTVRYGVGVLYPTGSKKEEEVDSSNSPGLLITGENAPESEENISNELVSNTTKALDAISPNLVDVNPDDFDLSLSNAFKPSSLGISFLAEFPPDSKLMVYARGGRYRRVIATIEGTKRVWWVRKKLNILAVFNASDILSANGIKVNPAEVHGENVEDITLQLEVFSRPFEANPLNRLITVCLVNRTTDHAIESTLFQSALKASVVSNTSNLHILPYPRPPFEHLDPEERSLDLLYRSSLTFAVGHGCAANWDKVPTGERVSEVTAECLPIFETPSITPDVEDETGKLIKVPMAPLAGLVPGDNGYASLENVISSYESWIEKKRIEASSLDDRYLEAANRHLDNCRICAERMRNGLSYLRSDPLAKQAFMLANRAIFYQQVRSRSESRKIFFDQKQKRISFSQPFEKLDTLIKNTTRGSWRAFQIAFLLMAIESTANPENPDREIVELIWFPTGGGKTEAYLGLVAFSLFLRKLRNPDDQGVHVIMRYTLRLLTAQQFLRASRLICAMEFIRATENFPLGEKPFAIGMWVGGSNTPNTRQEAIRTLRALDKSIKHVQSTFVLDRCPWCGAQMGLLDEDQIKKGAKFSRVQGYIQSGDSVIFKCTDIDCDYSKNKLPILVIDEDIYDNPPSMVIGTVDKFAMLAWKPQARSLFGIGKDGNRISNPPGLIIQDELHLISGPLGSMVGLYESLIEELCTDRRQAIPIRPKIISSTATIRRYQEQINALYARDQVSLFPPPGLEDGDSFFAKYATKDDGSLAPGKLYIGVYAPGLSSMQTTQVRTFTSLLQAPLLLLDEERDPWYTLLLFFNSLRELGTTLSLIQSDIPDYQLTIRNRIAIPGYRQRSLSEVKELTGRASSEDIPKALSALEASYPNPSNRPVDICLASNILEVGVDIDRLSLMAVVGQPKTTSQYIQVTGRVGRSWLTRPGLVVTLYSPTKPRDKSHYEKFRSYHQRLYAQVEPTSVTPFSPPALERALHALMAAYIIQTGSEGYWDSPYPYPAELITQLKTILLPRVKAIDPLELENFTNIFDRKARQWETWEPLKWTASFGESDIPLLRVAGDYATPEQENRSWPTMMSLRSVDSECILEIFTQDIVEGDNQNAG